MNRRSFIKLGGAAMLAKEAKSATLPVEQVASQPAANSIQRNRPNILLLMADQFRADCLGASGNPDIHTPHLDRLANEGIRFNSAYSSTPSCCPARTALLTGLSPWSHGMLGFTDIATNPYPVEKAQAMAQAGYYTTSIGKNHYFPIRNPHGYHHLVLDEHCSYSFHMLETKPGTEASWEERNDYESWFWSKLPDRDPHTTGLSWNDHRGVPFKYPEEMHATHWTGETAVNFLRQYERQEPFFLKVSFIRPHSPYDPPERFSRIYEDAPLPEARVGAWAKRFEQRWPSGNDIFTGKLPAEEIRRSRQCYYGNVSFVDDQIGRILEVLEKRDLLNDTFIIFVSDHGDMLADNNLWRKGYGYEQSAHIPMLIRPAAGMNLGLCGKVITNPVELRDVLPTLLDVAGAPIPESIEGKSLLHLVRSNGEGWREYIDMEHLFPYFEMTWNGLTDGRWKYIYYALTGEEQLFHLETDPSELTQLAGLPEHDGTLKLWRGRMVKHLEERGETWVKNGKLVLRPEPILFSPNFPGYAPIGKTFAETVRPIGKAFCGNGRC